jgi:hypothetical protein
VSERIRNLLTGERLALVTDGASFKRDSAVAVIASCSKLKKPVLLKVITPDEKSSNDGSSVYDFKLAEKRSCSIWNIRREAAAFGINLSMQMTCVMGDNVNHNKAVADELGTPTEMSSSRTCFDC